jgi:hypothetical protein
MSEETNELLKALLEEQKESNRLLKEIRSLLALRNIETGYARILGLPGDETESEQVVQVNECCGFF